MYSVATSTSCPLSYCHSVTCQPGPLAWRFSQNVSSRGTVGGSCFNTEPLFLCATHMTSGFWQPEL